MYALKLELKLNNKERTYLRGCAGYKRFVWNFALELLKASWQFEGITASDAKRLKEIKKVFNNDLKTLPEYSWMNDYPSTIYQSVFQDLGKALRNWREGRANFPVKKEKKKGDSFTVYRTAGIYEEKGQPPLPFSNRQVLQPGKKITLPGMGTYRLKEKIPFICSSQTFTVTRIADKWFVSFNLDAEKIPPTIHLVATATGIDLGVKTFATVVNSTGEYKDVEITAPKPMKKAKTKLGKLQYHNRNKQLGNRNLGVFASKRARRFYDKLARQHRHIANQRQDFLHKTTFDLAFVYAHLRIEDLNVAGMIANHKLSSCISDLGFYEFRRQLTYKCSWYGCKLEIVDRWYPSSKQCALCGTKNNNLTLSDREFWCVNPNCGLHHERIDRDQHAAYNLSVAPDEYVRLAKSEDMPVDKKEPTPLEEPARV